MIFDIIFGIFIAFSQILMFFMGLLFFSIGALLFLYPLWQRFTWLPVKARIVEVRARTSPFQNKTEETHSESAPHQSVDLLGDVKKSRGKNLSALVVIFLIMGVPLLFVGVGAYFALDYLHLKTRGVETQGQIVRFEEREDDEGGTTFAPVIRFQDSQDIERTLIYKISMSGRMGLESGQAVRVFYERDKPTHFMIDHFWLNMTLPVAFMGLGGLFLFVLFYQGARTLPEQQAALKKTTMASNIYYPTYEYITPDGRLVRTEADGGSSSLGDKIPGSDKTIFLKKDDFDKPAQPSYLIMFFGLCFAVPGGFILSLAADQFDFTIYTLIAGLGVLLFVAFKLAKIIKPRAEWDTREIFRSRMKLKRGSRTAQAVLLTPTEFNTLLQQHDRTILLWTPLYVLITMGMIVGGAYLYNSQNEFQAGALMAQGEVVRLISKNDSDGTIYYPLVAFETAAGQRIEFKDKVGSQPPSHSRGDIVRVLYQPASPRNAIIDRGWLNQLPGAGLLLAGGLLFLLAVRAFLASKMRLARFPSHSL